MSDDKTVGAPEGRLADEGDRQDRNERRVYEFIESLVRLGAETTVAELAIPRELANTLMTKIAHRVVLEHARAFIYVPVAVAWHLEPRNAEIWQQYNQPGPNNARACTPERIGQLASKHNVTERWIYDIVRRMREADSAARQGVLPGIDA